nr:geranylgeranyl transferase type-1 subunit beta-like [Cherax quadricarinatus]
MSTTGRYIFLRARHIKYLQRCLRVLPYSAVTFDTSRMTVLFFALSGLDLLDGLQEISKKEREHIVDWIYSLQIVPSDDKDQLASAGFRGGTSLASCRGQADYTTNISSFDCGHITMTYTALASLIILGDDLSRVNRKAVLAHVAALQCQDGRKIPIHISKGYFKVLGVGLPKSKIQKVEDVLRRFGHLEMNQN